MARLSENGGTYFDVFVVSIGGTFDPSLAIAAARAGGVGILDLTFLKNVEIGLSASKRLAALSRGRFGLLIHGRLGEVESAVLKEVGHCDTICILGDGSDGIHQVIARCRDVARRVGIVVTRTADVATANQIGCDFVVVKGHESGGVVGEMSTFVLLQYALANTSLPVVAWGGIGPSSAAGCQAAGAVGVVLDWAVALTRESPLPDRFRKRLAAMDGSETAALSLGGGLFCRLYHQPDFTARERLSAFIEEGASKSRDDTSLEEFMASLLRETKAEDRLWPMGQDAAFASKWVEQAPTVAAIIRMFEAEVPRLVAGSRNARALQKNGPLAQSHGTEFPIVQGPMTRVSDTAEFCEAVAEGGGLPFLALALMRKAQVRELLVKTRDRLGDRPWGVGVLGFVERDLQIEQLEVVEEFRPKFAIIAGGRPDQAASFEAKGIATYLHVPSPAMLDLFLREGARRFVFEGRECGGHVGPRTSFVLWESMIRVLVDAGLSPSERAKVHLLFAGGIHDAVSGAIVSALTQPLVELGMNVGVLIGTAYLFTKEAVECGAILQQFQNVAVGTDHTVLFETGPGHLIRCAESDYLAFFENEKRRLKADKRSHEEIRATLERLNVGRLRIAAKGIDRRVDAPAGDDPYVPVSGVEQLRQGMYMLGQVACLRDQVCTIRQLHEEVCEGAVAKLREVRPVVDVVEKRCAPTPKQLDIAIVGMSCLLPGAGNVAEFWDNILSGRDSVTEIPPDRFDADAWFDEDRTARDKSYSKWGGFLRDIPFDPLKYGIPPAAIPHIEPVQLLALELVDQALRDAGYAKDNPHAERTSVILGAGGGMGELGTNYGVRSMLPGILQGGDDTLWQQLPEWTEDSFPGFLLNVIAGRAANRFNFGGVNYTVDAACASSLAAVYLACRELTDGTSDLAIAGGCDTMQHPFAYMAFSKTSALSPRGRSRAFDADADGIAISEGLAAVVLKRREDAERDGDKIYAVIRAVAGGSDGRSKSMTAPCAQGQMRTLERAYKQAGFSPATVGHFEAHGTGTALGDATECEALSNLLVANGAPIRSAAIGSVKSMIGHTKCTAGVAGLIKSALALRHRVLPPTLHVTRPNPKAKLLDGPLYVNSEARPWLKTDSTRRAAVSAFGFGGSNFHAVLEEYRGHAVAKTKDASGRHRASELFLFGVETREALVSRVKGLIQEVSVGLAANGAVDLANLAYTWDRRPRKGNGAVRAAVVASSVRELLTQLSSMTQIGTAQNAGRLALSAGVFFSDRAVDPNRKIAFLFPGQGSQYVNMMRDLAMEFPEIAAWLSRADETLKGSFDRRLSEFVFPPPSFSDEERAAASAALTRTHVAQPALGVCSIGVLQFLGTLDLSADMAAGHSYGELVALHAAGVLDEAALFDLSWQRGMAILGGASDRHGANLGRMMAVRADEATVRERMRGVDDVWVANLNGRDQTVVSGTESGLDQLAKNLGERGIECTPLPVACGFHSPLMAPARERFVSVLATVAFAAPRFPVYSNKTAQPYPGDSASTRQLLADQLVHEVRFTDKIEAMYAAGARVFVEVGPGRVLSRLVGSVLADREHVSVATNARQMNDITQFLQALGQLHAEGVAFQTDRLYEGRELTELNLNRLASGKEKWSPTTWLVNGGYSRPMNQPPRVPSPKARMVVQQIAANVPNDSGEEEAVGGNELRGSGDAEVLLQFQETMRRFVEAQQAVMEAYLGGGGVPSQSTQARTRTSLPPTVPGVVGAELVVQRETVGPNGRQPIAAVRATTVVPVVHSPAPVPVSAVDSAESLSDKLVQIVSARTGYPPDMLNLDANMEADLGIDSIKRVEIIGAFRRAQLPTLDKPPAWFAERVSSTVTMRDILNAVAELVKRTHGESGGEPPNGKSKSDSSVLTSRFENLAGHDRGPVGGAKEGSARPFVQFSQTVSLGECPRCVAAIIEQPLIAPASVALADGVFLLTDDGQGHCEKVVHELARRGRSAVVAKANDLNDRKATEEFVRKVRAEHRGLAGIVHLLPLRSAPVFPGISEEDWLRHVRSEVRGLMFLLQAVSDEMKQADQEQFTVLCLSRGGGDWSADGVKEAAHAWRGGLSGLLKTAAREYPHVHFRAVDVDECPNPDVLLSECGAEGPVEVGYRGGRRWVVDVCHEELPDEAEVLGDSGLNEKSVVLVTGGARGITAQIAHEIALRTQAHFVLVGRTTPLDQAEEDQPVGSGDPTELRRLLSERHRVAGEMVTPKKIEKQVRDILARREVVRTLEAVRETGASVEYHACDVRDTEAFGTIVREVQKRLGGIDAVIHGAGIIEDKYLVDKTSDSFDRVVETKIHPLLTLIREVAPERLKFAMLFSSVAGFFGNPGQCDYAVANEMINRIARRLRDCGIPKVVSINWGPWRELGMVKPEVARQFEERGIGMVSVAAGRRAAWRELCVRNGGDVRVVIGPGPWMERANRMAEEKVG
ncbi:MAG: SDR family NAD(P)-dependent oxidoreductase [Planctomycetota bacterium]